MTSISNLTIHSPFIKTLIKKRTSSSVSGSFIHIAAFVDTLKHKKSNHYIRPNRKDRDR